MANLSVKEAAGVEICSFCEEAYTIGLKVSPATICLNCLTNLVQIVSADQQRFLSLIEEVVYASKPIVSATEPDVEELPPEFGTIPIVHRRPNHSIVSRDRTVRVGIRIQDISPDILHSLSRDNLQYQRISNNTGVIILPEPNPDANVGEHWYTVPDWLFDVPDHSVTFHFEVREQGNRTTGKAQCIATVTGSPTKPYYIDGARRQPYDAKFAVPHKVVTAHARSGDFAVKLVRHEMFLSPHNDLWVESRILYNGHLYNLATDQPALRDFIPVAEAVRAKSNETKHEVYYARE